MEKTTTSICQLLWGTLEGKKKGKDGSMKVKEWKKEVLDMGFKKERRMFFSIRETKRLAMKDSWSERLKVIPYNSTSYQIWMRTEPGERYGSWVGLG